jgi:uncharacterized protein YecE (DUF72 family)
VNPKRTKVAPPLQQTLFELEKPSEPANPIIERPFSLHRIFLGTSSFTAKGWEGTFYPATMRSRDFLSYYASQFQTVEIDSTFYGTPSASTVVAWYEKTPTDFIFAVKVPQVITHEKILVGCEAEFDEFIERMSLLGDKLGPMLLQFPKFDKWVLNSPDDFRARLHSFLKRVSNPAYRLAVEIRNRNWLDAKLTDFLRQHNVALAMTDTSFMLRPWEMKKPRDLITADFGYVRWLGNRKGIEEQTTTWDKTVLDRQDDLHHWVEIFKTMVSNTKVLKIFAFANNHYAGYAPATVEQFWKLWNGQ